MTGSANGALPESELLFLSALMSLSLLAVAVEVMRRLAGRSPVSNRQFWLRMGGGITLILVVLQITFGILFLRPSDGRIFGYYWSFCGLTLLLVMFVIRADVRWTTRDVLAIRKQIRDQRRAELQALIEHYPSRKSSSEDRD